MTKTAKKKNEVEVREPRPKPRRDVSHVPWRVWVVVWSAISAVTSLAGRRRKR
ncbi:hypothetical protein [Lentzea indica]|jgi:hypothetical protein|uniref:hypothetical protein n=1 Tax=Lentzea indica TaxID=2604800 RepID=UPI00143C452D|nr:hypothetical protein [Lentzea indica]